MATSDFLGDRRVAGWLLLLSFLLPLAALGLFIESGASKAFWPGSGDLVAMAPYARTFQADNLLYTATWVVQALGFTVLAWQLNRAGDRGFATVALVAVVMGAMLGILEGMFHVRVSTWAAQQAAQTGHTPAMYMALREWIGSLQTVNIALGILALAGFGLALLRTGFLSPWVGWMSVGWAALGALTLLLGSAIPAELFIMPLVIGIALLT